MIRESGGYIVRFHREGGVPSLEEAATQLGVMPSALSPSYGVQVENLKEGNFHVHLVETEGFDTSRGETFSNPRIFLQGPEGR